jgi:hypothetical protein
MSNKPQRVVVVVKQRGGGGGCLLSTLIVLLFGWLGLLAVAAVAVWKVTWALTQVAARWTWAACVTLARWTWAGMVWSWRLTVQGIDAAYTFVQARIQQRRQLPPPRR